MTAVPQPRRRTVLAGFGGAVLAGLTGCTSEPAGPPPPDPDDLLRAAAVAREQSLLRAYDAALLASPTLTARLLPLREQHAEHLAALVGPPPSGSPSGSASAAPPSGGPPTSVVLPTDPAATLRTLVTAELAAAAGHGADAVRAADRPLAGLLASLSASEQSHPVTLA